MYWRIRKITPDIIVKRFSVYAFLIVSVLMNILLFTRVSSSKAATTPLQRSDFEKFARQVTQHLFDANYLTVEDSMHQIGSEIVGPAQAQLMRDEVIPRTEDELHAIARQLTDSKSVSAIKFDQLQIGDKPVERQTAKGPIAMQPVETRVEVAVHDTEGVVVKTLHLRYYLAYAPGANKGEQRLVVYDLENLPNDQPPAQ